MSKSCGSCVQCEKYTVDGKEHWVCENYDRGVGMPYDVYPPNDEACSNWTDNPEDRDKPQDALCYFVDHYWDDDWDDDWDEEDDW